MTPLQKLAAYFAKFPGIGERQAKRFAYFLLESDPTYVKELSELMIDSRKNMKRCSACFRLFDAEAKTICPICEDPKTNNGILLVVEKDADFESIAKSKIYTGRYFVLGGLVPLVEKSTPQKIRINELQKRIERDGNAKNLKEIILAFSLTPSGEHTDSYLREVTSSLAKKYSIVVSSFGRGLSTGTEVEYSDRATLVNAIQNRQ